MKYYLVAVISIWRPPSDFLQQCQTWRNWSFYHLLFTPFADIASVLLNRKKRQCDKYYNGVPDSKMSDVKNIYFVYSLFQTSDYGCSAGIHKIAGPNPGLFSRRLEMSLFQPSSGWLPFLFWVIGKNEAAKREKLAPYFICLVQDTLDL